MRRHRLKIPPSRIACEGAATPHTLYARARLLKPIVLR
jgi:hypothetical protein